MTRTYERQTIRWERADIEALEAAGRAQYFPGLPGYVIDKKHPVRNHQIVDSEPVILAKPYNADAHQADAENAAEAAVASIALVPDSADEDALLAKFGV